jgi:putative ABC transport system permease protein
VSPVKLVPSLVEEQPSALVGVDPATFGEVVTLVFTSGSLVDLPSGGLVVDAQTATDTGLAMGDPVAVRFASGSADYTVTGVYESAGRFSGFVVDSESIIAAGADPGDSVVYVKAEPGADVDVVQAAMTEALADNPTVEVLSQTDFKEQITSSVDQILLVMVMLLSLAILIAVLGIVNTLVLSVVERTREIGMLRAVGALRRQIRTMVVLEALVIAVFGAVVGLVLGVWFAVALQRTLVDQGITVLDIPWLGIVAFLVVAGVVGVLAALWPAFRAGRLNVLEAISTE